MKMTIVKEKCPALYSAIVGLAGDNMGRVNLDYTFPDSAEVLRAQKAIAPLYGKTLGEVIPSKGPDYDFAIDFWPGVETDNAIDQYVGTLDTVMMAIEATLPDGKWLGNFINRIFQFDLSGAIKPCWL